MGGMKPTSECLDGQPSQDAHRMDPEQFGPGVLASAGQAHIRPLQVAPFQVTPARGAAPKDKACLRTPGPVLARERARAT